MNHSGGQSRLWGGICVLLSAQQDAFNRREIQAIPGPQRNFRGEAYHVMRTLVCVEQTVYRFSRIFQQFPGASMIWESRSVAIYTLQCALNKQTLCAKETIGIV